MSLVFRISEDGSEIIFHYPNILFLSHRTQYRLTPWNKREIWNILDKDLGDNNTKVQLGIFWDTIRLHGLIHGLQNRDFESEWNFHSRFIAKTLIQTLARQLSALMQRLFSFDQDMRVEKIIKLSLVGSHQL